jgi:hypothetical protein
MVLLSFNAWVDQHASRRRLRCGESEKARRPLSVPAMSDLHSHKPIGSVLQRQPFLVSIVIAIHFIP